MKFATILAVPAIVASAATIGLQQRDANFDDIKVVLPVASLQPIGDYKGLSWDGFNVIDVSVAPTGVAPRTEPNVAVQYILSEGLDETATLKPASDKTTYFSLQSFYFGCVASSQETVAGVPIACTLKLTGKRKGKVVVTQNISFQPTGLLTSDMKKQAFAGGFASVDEIDFEQTGVLAAATSVLYDNVEYTTFTL